MSTTAVLAVIDLALGALEVATKANLIISNARIEGREVTMDDYKVLLAENNAKRKAWDKAAGHD